MYSSRDDGGGIQGAVEEHNRGPKLGGGEGERGDISETVWPEGRGGGGSRGTVHGRPSRWTEQQRERLQEEDGRPTAQRCVQSLMSSPVIHRNTQTGERREEGSGGQNDLQAEPGALMWVARGAL